MDKTNKVFVKVSSCYLSDAVRLLMEMGGINKRHFGEVGFEDFVYIDEHTGLIEIAPNDALETLLIHGYTEVKVKERSEIRDYIDNHGMMRAVGESELPAKLIIPLGLPEDVEAFDKDGKVVKEVVLTLCRKRWRPKVGGQYYYVTSNDDDTGFKWESKVWLGHDDSGDIDGARYLKGNCFKTKEEAEEVCRKMNKQFEQFCVGSAEKKPDDEVETRIIPVQGD